MACARVWAGRGFVGVREVCSTFEDFYDNEANVVVVISAALEGGDIANDFGGHCCHRAIECGIEAGTEPGNAEVFSCRIFGLDSAIREKQENIAWPDTGFAGAVFSFRY